MRSNFNEKGEFRFGKFNYEKARETAENCAKFKLDNDEEEMACGGEISYYDCAFRRWSAESFTCAFFQKLNRSAKSYFLRFFRKLESQKYFTTRLSLKFPCVFASRAYKASDSHKNFFEWSGYSK